MDIESIIFVGQYWTLVLSMSWTYEFTNMMTIPYLTYQTYDHMGIYFQ